MTFAIDTGAPDRIAAKSDFVEPTDRIRYAGRATHAERAARQIAENVRAHETVDALDDYWQREDLIIDAIDLAWPEYARVAIDAYEEHRVLLQAAEDYAAREAAKARPAHPANIVNSERSIPMFTIQTGASGVKGPFINYKQRAGQGMPDGSWYLREKSGDDWDYTDFTETFRRGIVWDMFATHEGTLGGTLQLGWIKFIDDKPADRRMWKTPLQAEPRPDEGKTADGAFIWQNDITFRVAIGGNKDAQMEVSGWGGYKGMAKFVEAAINPGFGANVGLCPLVQYTGWRTEGSGKTRLHVPEFAIAKWVPRPACLTPQAPTVVAAAPEPAAPAAPAAPQPIAAKPVPEDIAF